MLALVGGDALCYSPWHFVLRMDHFIQIFIGKHAFWAASLISSTAMAISPLSLLKGIFVPSPPLSCLTPDCSSFVEQFIHGLRRLIKHGGQLMMSNDIFLHFELYVCPFPQSCQDSLQLDNSSNMWVKVHQSWTRQKKSYVSWCELT